jgi:hypothetical protein
LPQQPIFFHSNLWCYFHTIRFYRLPGDRRSNTNEYADQYADIDTHGHPDSDADGHPDIHAHDDPDSDTHGHADVDANGHADSDADLCIEAGGCPCSGLARVASVRASERGC